MNSGRLNRGKLLRLQRLRLFRKFRFKHDLFEFNWLRFEILKPTELPHPIQFRPAKFRSSSRSAQPGCQRNLNHNLAIGHFVKTERPKSEDQQDCDVDDHADQPAGNRPECF